MPFWVQNRKFRLKNEIVNAEIIASNINKWFYFQISDPKKDCQAAKL